MKKITITLFLLVAATTFSQHIYMEAGKTISSFDYKNSQGERLDNLQATPHSFMAIGYRSETFIKNLNMSFGTSFSGYGAIGSDDSVGNYMEWDVNYLEFNTGLDYELFKIKETTFYVKGTASMAFLVQGTQTINNRVINLRNEEDFDEIVFDFRAGFGFLQPISSSLSVYAQYMHGRSLMLKEGTAVSEDQETLRYVSDTVSFGLLINLSEYLDNFKR
jgi:hypothetical protein